MLRLIRRTACQFAAPPGFRFCLDRPTGAEIDIPSLFTGWYIPKPGHQPVLRFYVNGRAAAVLWYGDERPDVQAAFPDAPVHCGFSGALLLEAAPGDVIQVVLRDDGAKRRPVLHSGKYRVARYIGSPLSPLLARVLRCPDCHRQMSVGKQRLRCPCGQQYMVVDGVPMFHDEEVSAPRRSDVPFTHPYGAGAARLLEQVGADGLVLDFGAGNTPPESVRENVVRLDIQQYPHTSVVSTMARLPFADNTFDGVISQAVFEHLRDPHHVARELHRVLKPGGRIYVDTAFLQPLHADPHHYFNMTVAGLRTVMAPFHETDSGVARYQYPSFGLRMQLEAVLPLVSNATWKARLMSLQDLLIKEGHALDIALGDRGRETIAAGVYFAGKKRDGKQS